MKSLGMSVKMVGGCFVGGLLLSQAMSFECLAKDSHNQPRKRVSSSGSQLASRSNSNGRRSGQVDEAPIVLSQAAPESASGSSTAYPGRFAVGFSTVPVTTSGTTAALTAIVDLSPTDCVQGFFSLPYTSPFNIGAAAFFKHTIVHSQGAGFHIGAGLGLADVNDATTTGAAFALNISAIGGFHFELPGIPHVNVHLDGGPTFALVNTNPSVSNLRVGALSTALGASIVYVF